MAHHTPMKPRTVRCIETGQTLTVSSSKAKRLVKLGGYEEVTRKFDPPFSVQQSRTWRRVGLTAAAITMAAIILVWLRLVNFI